MPPQLVPLNDGPSIVLDKPIMLLGRHSECDIQIDSRKISRRHCCIAQVGDYLVIRDLDSTNGIRINGERVQEGKLHSGDELTIGSHRYQVTWGDIEAPVNLPQRAQERRASVMNDDVLEECDEPVPLAGPCDVPEPPLARPIRPAGPIHDVPAVPAPDPIIIPDEIRLAPSDDKYGPSPQESASHH